MINGSEKVLIAQERMANNHVYIFRKSQPSKFAFTAECRSVCPIICHLSFAFALPSIIVASCEAAPMHKLLLLSALVVGIVMSYGPQLCFITLSLLVQSIL